MLVMVFALSMNPAQSADAAQAQLAKSEAARVGQPGGTHIAFGARERILIQDYYRKNPASMRHAASGVRVAPNGRLAADADKQPLPAPLVRQLPALPQGYQRVIVGKDVVLVEAATQTVLDVIAI